jgi:hypothetical protein
MPRQIAVLKVSTLFFEAFTELLADSPPEGAPMAFMGRASDYARELERARLGKRRWTLPWPVERASINHFWRHYMDNRLPSQVTGETAWSYLVPLRQTVVEPLFEPPSIPACRWQAEAFSYPHGVGLVVTATLDEELALPAMVDRAVDAQRALRFQVLRTDASGADGRSVGDVLREAMLGEGAAAGLRSEAFTVATVIRGSGATASRKVREKGAVHRALEALCSWNPSWDAAPPHPQEEAALPIRSAPAGHVLYASKHGRAVWFPAAFSVGRRRKNTLGCYHRNLVLLSLQVEGLLQLMRLAGEHLRRGELMPARLAGVSRQGAGILGRLYGGAPGTYRSASAPRQVDDSGYRPSVERVREYFGQGPLHR